MASSIPQNHRPSPAASSTANITSYNEYNVFLNHRGPDTKNGFTSHLYNRLRLAGIRAFLDKKDMEEGSKLTPQIINAIKTASVHVAIFSKNYAESNWCLDELVWMVESGGVIIPVFFDVKPAALRWSGKLVGLRWMPEWMQGWMQRDQAMEVYAKGLRTLANRMDNGKRRYDDKTIEKWVQALAKVAGTSGFELETCCNGDEGELVEKIVERVSKILKKPPFSVLKYETGLVEKVNGFEVEVGKLLPQLQESESPRVVGIVGLGGVGKTTLAEQLFHKNISEFQNYCFFSMSQIAATTPLDLDSLFPQLFDRLSRLGLPLRNVDVVRNMYNMNNPSLEEIQNFPSLVILDGVNSVPEGEALLSIKEVIHPTSSILITSRDREVLRSLEVEDALIYTLNGLDTHSSRKLFCFHAFHEAAPLQGYEYLVDGFSRVCDGLPLLLKVLGAFVYGRDRSEWGALLDRFEQIHSQAIEKKLEFIYGRLNRQEQEFFLEIACRDIEEESTDEVLQIWRGRSGWEGLMWFQTLVEKRLVEVDRENCIKMHHHFKDLGINISRQQR